MFGGKKKKSGISKNFSLQNFDDSETAILQVMALHDGWVSGKLIHAVTGIGEKTIQASLKRFNKKGWVLKEKESDGEFWRLGLNEWGEQIRGRLGLDQRRELHGKIFSFIQGQKDPNRFAPWLAWHSAEAGQSLPAYSWNLRMAEIMEESGDLEAAVDHLLRAKEFSGDDFRRAYLTGKLGLAWAARFRFADAEQDLKKALEFAESMPWPEFFIEFGIPLAGLYCHQGYFQASEPHFRRALQILESRGDQDHCIPFQKNLGTALLEQAKYREALEVFGKIHFDENDREKEFDRALLSLNLAQTYHGLGMISEADQELKQAKTLLTETQFQALHPFFHLLEGKFLMVEGQRSAALRSFEAAALGFEERGDLGGKVEVLLAMSAPLLENQLISEAETLIQQIAAWEDLRRFPALEHSVHLRRLAIGAFSGTWVSEDMGLIKQDAARMGRTEDWLQFWFHFALAAQRNGNEKFFALFIKQARRIADQIAGRLTPAQQETFVRRPDVARILRLSTPRSEEEIALIRAGRGEVVTESAEAATLAPPISGKNK